MSNLVATLLIAMLAAGPPGRNDCTYDQSAQVASIAALAARIAGAQVSSSGHEVSWRAADGAAYRIRYGGCTHLGHTVAVAREVAAQLDEAEVLVVANELAAAHWGVSEAARLAQATAAGDFTREESAGAVKFHIPHEDLFEFYVEHSFSRGVDRVSIHWGRNF